MPEVAIASRRRYRTEFAPVVFPLDWNRTHVQGVDVGPSEVYCAQCSRLMMPLVPTDTFEDCKKMFERFPMREATGNVPAETPASGCSMWTCLGCGRGACISWD